MRFVCDPLSIVLLGSTVFVFVLLAVLLAHTIVVMSGLRKIVKRLSAVSDEVESMITAPLEALEAIVTSLITLLQGWFQKRKERERGKEGSHGRRVTARSTKFETKELS